MIRRRRAVLTSADAWRTLPFLISLICTELPASHNFISTRLSYTPDIDADLLSQKYYQIAGWSSAYFIAIMCWLQAPKRCSAAVRQVPYALLFALLACFSTLWSANPLRTVILSGSLMGLLLVSAVGAGTFVSYPGLLVRQVAILMGVGQLANLCLIVVFPEFGKDPEGRWMGWLGGANALGGNAFCAIWANAVWMHVSAPGKRLWAYLFIAASVVTLIGSDSITAILATCVCAMILAGVAYGRLSKVAIGFIAVAGVMLCVTIASVVGLDSVASAFGRTTTLTGRTTVWSLAMTMFSQRPWLGYGFGDTQDYVVRAGLNASNFHNSFIEVLIRLGVIGVVVFGLFVIPLVVKSFAAMRRYPPARWYGSLFAGYLVLGLAESTSVAVRQDVTFVFWMCAMAFSMGLRAEESARTVSRSPSLTRFAGRLGAPTAAALPCAVGTPRSY